MNSVPVEVHGLGRRFGRRVALERIELSVFAGEIVGLVGPNGSGKTTLLRILAGLLRAHVGEVRLFGRDPERDAARVLERVRFAFAPPAVFPELTAREHLRHLTRIRTRRMPRASRHALEEALELVGLRERGDDRVRTFSMGMKQRLALAAALLPEPELIVLDEPTEGLDPLAVLELRGLLARLRDERGIAVLLSSHLLLEVEELVDRLLVLREGQSLFFGRPAELVQGGARLRLVVDDAAVGRAVLAERGLAVQVVDGELELLPGALSLSEALSILATAGLRLREFRTQRPTLERALLARLRGAALGAGAGAGAAAAPIRTRAGESEPQPEARGEEARDAS